MSGLIHLVPVTLAVACWYLIYRINKPRQWLRIGELVFWDIVLLIVLFLIWLIWF